MNVEPKSGPLRSPAGRSSRRRSFVPAQAGTRIRDGTAKRTVGEPYSLYSKIEVVSSSMLRWMLKSSVTAQLTATWQARRGGMPCEIIWPA